MNEAFKMVDSYLKF
jgi:CheY-like chemotaxis protein